MVILSFLFASQDAMSSAIVFAFQLTADNPEVLEKIREEQYRVRGNDLERPLTLELMDEMVYTRAAVKEVMRLAPSVIMVSLAPLAGYETGQRPEGVRGWRSQQSREGHEAGPKGEWDCWRKTQARVTRRRTRMKQLCDEQAILGSEYAKSQRWRFTSRPPPYPKATLM
jgi:hypothetical protein